MQREIVCCAFIIEGDWGGWARSGPAIGWHTLLRRHLSDQVLVHGRPEVREAEAAAMYGGKVDLDDAPLGGLRVRLGLPAAV